MASANTSDDEWRGDDHVGESLLDPLGLEALRREVGEQLAQSMKPSTEALKVQYAPNWLGTLKMHVDTSALDRMHQVVAREVAETFAKIDEIWLSALPENVRDLDPDELERLHEVAEEQRIGVMWAPDAAVMTQLMTATTADERAEVICSNAEVIVESCRMRLAEIDVPELADLVQLAFEAARAFTGGQPAAAQALATNVVDTAVTQYFGDGPRRVRASIGEIKKMAARSEKDEEYWRWILAVTMAGIPPLWHEYDYGSAATGTTATARSTAPMPSSTALRTPRER
ncbi:hypothetical protein ACQPX6_19920 [Actinomycetospora sp. CA-101289]|uniref:hypothetical protein n=1 Tax=Actinomycetospora sp. CA-101289 TaxID=3239893 RepID=UPI003D95A07C